MTPVWTATADLSPDPGDKVSAQIPHAPCYDAVLDIQSLRKLKVDNLRSSHYLWFIDICLLSFGYRAISTAP